LQASKKALLNNFRPNAFFAEERFPTAKNGQYDAGSETEQSELNP